MRSAILRPADAKELTNARARRSRAPSPTRYPIAVQTICSTAVFLGDARRGHRGRAPGTKSAPLRGCSSPASGAASQPAEIALAHPALEPVGEPHPDPVLLLLGDAYPQPRVDPEHRLIVGIGSLFDLHRVG